MEFKKYKLSDLSIGHKGTYGIGASAVEYNDDLYTYLRITDIMEDGTLNYLNLKSVNDEKASKYLLKKGDIVFARTGNSTGKGYYYDGEIKKLVYAGFLIKFTLDKMRVNPKYIKYYIMTNEYKNWVKEVQTGSTRGNINEKMYGSMQVKLPNREYQDKVVMLLDSITNKIKINSHINDNLYEQMEILYKELFVDNIEKFKWKKDNIYSISNVIYGAPFKSSLFNEEKNGKPIIRIRDLKTQEFKTYTTEIHPKGYSIKKGDIIVGMDGEFRSYIWGNEEAWLNQRVCVFDNKRKEGKAFLYYTLKPLLKEVERTETATTVIHIGKNDFDSFEIYLPPDDLLNKYDNVTTPMINRIIKNISENKILANLKDTLLPKLMNGEIDLDKIEI